jgi:hypothetical protein
MKDVKSTNTRQPLLHMEASVETPEGQATGALWPVRYPGVGGPSSFSSPGTPLPNIESSSRQTTGSDTQYLCEYAASQRLPYQLALTGIYIFTGDFPSIRRFGISSFQVTAPPS